MTQRHNVFEHVSLIHLSRLELFIFRVPLPQMLRTPQQHILIDLGHVVLVDRDRIENQNNVCESASPEGECDGVVGGFGSFHFFLDLGD